MRDPRRHRLADVQPSPPLERIVLAGPQDDTEDRGPMTDSEALAIMRGTCLRKKRYDTQGHAMADARSVTAAEHQMVCAYQCPFSQLQGGKHWHVGHPPSQCTMFRLVEAMRLLHDHTPSNG